MPFLMFWQGADMDQLRADDESFATLDQRTRFALAHILDVAAAGAKIVTHGRETYFREPMLKLAGEAVVRRLDLAVSRLDQAFLAAHPHIDWAATTTPHDGCMSGGDYDSHWTFLSTQQPIQASRVAQVLDAWAVRPPPIRPADAVASVDDDVFKSSAAPPDRHGQVAGGMYDLEFRQLVERLDDWVESARAPSDDGPIDLVLPGGRRVRIVMTADDLAEMYVVVGTFDGALFSVMESVRDLPDDAPYLVYGHNYLLEPRTGTS